MNAADRPALLAGIAGVLAAHRDDPGAAGGDALRLLRLADAFWSDLLPGPPFEPGDRKLEATGLGYRTHAPLHDCGRAIRTLLHLATPYELAQAVLATNEAGPAELDGFWLADLVRELLARRPKQTAEQQGDR